MYEAMARYQSQYGLKPIGPHRPLADALLGAAKEECSGCRGRGLADAPDGSTWQVCKPCRGFGSFFTKPAQENLNFTTEGRSVSFCLREHKAA
jgi:hypothetical protein